MRPVTPIGILAAKLKNIIQHLEEIKDIQDFKSELEQAYRLASDLEPYLESCSTLESPALMRLVKDTKAEDWDERFTNGDTIYKLEQEMLSGHIEGQTLKFIVRMTKAKRILEIGMFTGYSALAMAEALPLDGEIIACEIDPYVAEFAQECFKKSPDGHKISVKVGPALETIKELADNNKIFDIIFIDADKINYLNYLNLVLDKEMLAPDGLICADNTLMQGEPYLLSKLASSNGIAIARFNEALVANPNLEQVLLPIRDGFTLIRRIQ